MTIKCFYSIINHNFLVKKKLNTQIREGGTWRSTLICFFVFYILINLTSGFLFALLVTVKNPGFFLKC